MMVGLWCDNQSGVTELLIMRDPHYGLMRDPHYSRMCFKLVKTPGALHSYNYYNSNKSYSLIYLLNTPFPIATRHTVTTS